MRTRNSMSDSQLIKEGIQSLILTSPIGLHVNNFSGVFSLNMTLKILEDMKDFRLVFEEIDPRISTVIINKGNVIRVIANRYGSRTPNIRMYQIEGSTTFIFRARIRKLMTLCLLTRVTHRLNMMTSRPWKQIVSNNSLNDRKRRMTQTTMPYPCGWPTNTTCLLVVVCSNLLRPQRVETTLTPALMDCFLRGSILDEKMVRVKFNISIIV